MLKRAFDLLAVSFGLQILFPLFVAIAVAVRADSRGPALFRQRRVGRDGEDFYLYKFRTMTVREGAERGSFDPGESSRVTRVGRVLRATKLDELPQLWNVLRGDMALVGPRPEVRCWVEVYPERWAFIHTVRPGITDPAAVIYRHEERTLASALDPKLEYREVILPRKLKQYEDYVRTRSFLGDLVILLRTAVAIAQVKEPNSKEES